MKIENKKIVLIGCTGNLGKPIYDFLDKSKNQIIILSRKCPHFLKDKKSKNFFKMDFSILILLLMERIREKKKSLKTIY